MALASRHIFYTFLILTLLQLVPALHEWIQLGMPQDNVLLISLPIWLVCFYQGPFWCYYKLQQFNWLKSRHLIFRALLFLALMLIGTMAVAKLHSLFFPHFTFTPFEQFFSALLWGTFFFTLWEFYLLQQRLMQEKELRKQLQLYHLANQLNPHFLFNSLNTISALMLENIAKADEVLHKFADILRYAIDSKEQLIELDTEVAICRFYLELEQERFGDRLKVNWHIDVDLSRFKVPPLLFQPILENAVKHNKGQDLTIDITIYQQQGYLYIEIGDNGKGFDNQVLAGEQTGLGIKLITQRLALLKLGQLTLSNNQGAHHQLQLEAIC